MITSVTLTPAYSATAVTLHGGATASTRNLSKVEGLFGPPSPRVVERARPGVDGVILDETRFLDGRTIVLEGELWGSTGGAALEDLSTISEAFTSTLLSEGKLTVTYENGTVRWCNVKLVDSVQVAVEGSSRLVQYQATLKAADPRLYETTLRTVSFPITPFTGPSGIVYTMGTTSATNLVNSGTAPTSPTVTITVPLTANQQITELLRFTVTPPSGYQSISPWGATQVFEWTSTAGTDIASRNSTTATNNAVAVVDSAKRTVTQTLTNGSWSQRPRATSEFPLLYPGTSTGTWTYKTTMSSATGASCQFTYYYAYW
ncbi:MAG: hypothetical protein EBR82_49150 [Caulobacteraceae bacterium]|nr:hypothetical protein [Caulobacteraceae bacterium]